MSFKAVIVEQISTTETVVSVKELEDHRLPDGNVTVKIEYTTINYKDGLCMKADGGIVRNFPHIPGIDFSGIVESSDDPRYQPGDEVILTGWGVGERYWGGFAQKARVNADWLVPLPDGLTTRQAMAVGTAGLAAILAIMALENHGLQPDHGPVLVTGATGGVGSIATTVLARNGYEVACVTGRPENEDYLKKLGASQIVDRDRLSTVSQKPLEAATWAGCVDAVGGTMLARIIGQMKYGSSIAAVGLAGGAALPTNVMPFLLRGMNLLGIDSVMQPFDNRQAAWNRLVEDLSSEKIEEMIKPATLTELPALGEQILAGKVKGRVVIDVNR
ncbi:MAG: oxidoreductase [Akkermansiaceae bacterium]|nr:oxidoreductase [Akkermansiaceae bacterium]